MPRAARLDAPGALHHVMVRGLERRSIFRDDADRRDFVERLGAACTASRTRVFAWALLPNHAHVLLASGVDGLSALMRRVLTGYAGMFNRRHRRHGHLFQNRFKSILVEEEPYLLELVRYIHLNPVRAGILPEIGELDRYEWTGHARLMGWRSDAWQDVHTVLAQFGARLGAARSAYRAFVVAGLQTGARSELSGGGLRRSRGAWERRTPVRRGREQWAFDERVLGSSEFVARVLAQCAPQVRVTRASEQDPACCLEALIRDAAVASGLSPAEVGSGSKRRAVVAARTMVSRAALRAHGIPLNVVASTLAISPRSVLRAVERAKPSYVVARG
jgi:putative transposase